jgi:tRNA threonylcarbamoyladenosine biosynthesis protein TsaE
MDKFKWTTNNADETMTFAERLAELLDQGDVLTLEGDLGAGKTTFTKGLAKGLGITKTVNSPTFTIIKEYMGRLPLYHMDVYRVEDAFEDLGFDEYFHGNGVTVVEWAHLIGEQLPEEFLKISLHYKSETEREIVLTPFGSRYVHVCKELMK